MQEPNSSISSFRLFLLRILLPLILIIGVAGVLFTYFFEKEIILKNQSCGAYKVNRIMHETHPDEIPIFGSSRAEGSFLPDSLGPKYFNYGINGTKYDVTLFFLDEECRKHKTNEWVVLNFDLDGLLNGVGDISNFIPNSDYPPLKKLLGKEFMPYFNLPFLKYYGRFETYARSYMSGRIELTKVNNKGAVLDKNVMPEKEFESLVNERKSLPTTFTCDPALKQKFFETIARNTNMNFVIVISPYHWSYFEKYANPGDAAQFLDSLKSYRNVRVLDFSKMELADSLFLNTTHINFKGALRFNRQLRDSLERLGVH